MAQTRPFGGDGRATFEVDYNAQDGHAIALRCTNNSVAGGDGKSGYYYAVLRRTNDPTNLTVSATFPPKQADADPPLVTTVAVPVAPNANQFMLNLVNGKVTGVTLDWSDNATPPNQ